MALMVPLAALLLCTIAGAEAETDAQRLKTLGRERLVLQVCRGAPCKAALFCRRRAAPADRRRLGLNPLPSLRLKPVVCLNPLTSKRA